MLALVALLLVVALALLVALLRRMGSLQAEVRILIERLHSLRRQVEGLESHAQPREAASATIPAAPPSAATRLPPPAPLPPPLPVPAAAAKPSAPPAPPAPPKPRSRVAESAREALRKIGNWILVGEEHRPSGVTAEYAIATTWLVRVCILAFVLCAAYFLVWSAQRQWIGPVGRVAIAILAGVGMLVSGVRLLGKRYHLLGLGLLGGGICVLYCGVYAMGPRYGLVTPAAVFGLMALVTVVAGILAVRLDAMLIAVLGLAGGYLTPVLIHSDAPRLAILYTYVLLLGAGILAIAWRKAWRLLNYLSLIGTYLLFCGSLEGYRKATDFPLALSFLMAFFVLQSALVYLNHVLRRQASTTLEILHLTANALLAAGLGYHLIRDACGRPYPVFLALGLALYFTLHVVALLRRRSEDRALLVTMIALAGAFATWALPLVLERERLTIAISLLAFTFLWLGQKLGSRFLQNLAHGLYVAVFARLLLWDFGHSYRHFPAPDLPLRLYWHHLLDRLVTFGLTIGSVVAAFVVEQRQFQPEGPLAVSPRADTPTWVGPTIARGVFYWAALAGIVAFLNFELAAMFTYARPWRLPVLTLVWCGLALYFLVAQRGEARPGVMYGAMTATLLVATLKLLALDLPYWQCGSDLVYRAPYHAVAVAARLLDFAALVAAFLLVWRLVAGRASSRAGAWCFGYGALFLALLYATLEWHTLLFWKFPRFQAGGLSVLWAAFAMAYVGGGIWKNVKPLRYLGLALMTIVIAKVFLLDLHAMEVIVRVVAFFAVGILLLIGAFAYMRAGRTFAKHEP